MLKHRTGYLMLVGFAAVMVVLLALDDPTARPATSAESTQPVVVLFSELSSSAQIYAIEVQDVATGKDVLLMRDDQGWWYAPALNTNSSDIPAESINQTLIETAAEAIRLMATDQWYENTTENAAAFGLEPQPAYRIRFGARDTAGVSFAPVVLMVGDVNPDNVAYYVWPDTDQRIYLISSYLMNPVLQLVTESIQVTPTPVESPSATAPVP
jgi:hypothetical protein